jgi:hypothetical protein
MNALVLAMPDDPATQAPWLDRQLVGPKLAALVAELDAIHGRSEPASQPVPAPALDTVLADNRRALLERGLSALPPRDVGTLLRHPRLLLELQETVLLQGGRYWQELNRSDPKLARSAAAVWKRVATQVRNPAAESRTEESLHRSASPSRVREGEAAPRQPLAHRLVLAWATLATIAATVLALLSVGQPSPWGWNRPGVLIQAQSESAGAYLNRLADTAHEWFDERPATAEDLARRLGTFRADCARLIVADQAHLPPDQRAWLVEHCRTWAGKLDQAIHALEEGAPPERVRADADAILNRLITVLRERARSIS